MLSGAAEAATLLKDIKKKRKDTLVISNLAQKPELTLSMPASERAKVPHSAPLENDQGETPNRWHGFRDTGGTSQACPFVGR